MQPSYLLKLYVTGQTPRTIRAIRNLEDICATELVDKYSIQVIDVLKQPRLAEEEKILATPTLIRELPQPLQRIVGDLSDREKVLFGLDLVSKEEE